MTLSCMTIRLPGRRCRLDELAPMCQGSIQHRLPGCYRLIPPVSSRMTARTVTARLAPRLIGERPVSSGGVSGFGVVSETLLIPLAARAMLPRAFPELPLNDPVAAGWSDRRGADLGYFESDHATMRASCVRTLWFDDQCAAFIQRHPRAVGVSIGCGMRSLAMTSARDERPRRNAHCPTNQSLPPPHLDGSTTVARNTAGSNMAG